MSTPTKRPWKRRLARLTAFLVLLALCLALLEVGTRLVLNAHGMHFGIEMWKYARSVKRPSAVAAMAHEHAPHAHAFLMGADVRISGQGLRDRDFAPTPEPDTYRILVLGDSVTFGWGVAQDKTYPKLLEKMLNDKPAPGLKSKVEVINAGVGNYNTSQEVAYFKERGLGLRPDMVILGFFLNDGEPTPRPAEGWLARNSAFYVLLASSWDNALRGAGRRQDYKDYYKGLYDEGRPGWVECRRALGELIALCKENKIDLRIAILPELHHLDLGYPFREVHDKVKALAGAGGVPVYDLLDAPWTDAPQSYWVTPGDAHPNEKGHQVLAEALYTALQKNK